MLEPICSKCGLKRSADAGEECPRCGHSDAGVTPAANADDDALDFVVSETAHVEQELVGGVRASPENDLGVQSNADLMDQEAHGGGIQPIGSSSPPPPPPPDYAATDAAAGNPAQTAAVANQGQEIKKLSREEVKAIEQDLYASSSYLTDEEKLALLKSASSQPQTVNTQPPVAKRRKEAGSKSVYTGAAEKRPKMAYRVHGIAYFAKNIIQVTGAQDLHEGDEIVISDRAYVLKRKQISSKVVMGFIAPALALAMFGLGAYLTTGSGASSGRIVGITLDKSRKPYLQRAEVRLPEIGKTVQANPQGFFQIEDLDAGSYRVEYVVEETVVGVDFATAVDGKTTTLALFPNQSKKVTSATKGSGRSARAQSGSSKTTRSSSSVTSRPAKKPDTPTRAKSRSSKPAVAKPSTAKLALEASVDGARVKLGGKVVGAGNLVYGKLKPGTHDYVVSRTGYQDATGRVTLKSGETTRLEISLIALSAEAKRETYSADQFYESAVDAAKAGRTEEATQDLNEAISKQASHADAYQLRAQMLIAGGDIKAAYDDFVRAAEIYRFKRDYRKSGSAYNQAIDLDAKSIEAYIGRGSLYLARGEAIAAVADFGTVVRFDKHSSAGHLGLGKARYEQGNYRQAVKHFKDARSIEPKNLETHKALMLAYLKYGKLKDVGKTYKRFKKVASEGELAQFHSDPKYSGVVRLIESGR